MAPILHAGRQEHIQRERRQSLAQMGLRSGNRLGMKILIAGYGSIGKRHFNNLRALGVKDFVFLRSNNSTLDVSELAQYPVEHNTEAALAHKPDAVVVSNPTALHLDVAIPAAAQGCSLLMEKPISHSLARVDELRQAAAAGGSRILVGFQWRFHPTLQKAAEIL